MRSCRAGPMFRAQGPFGGSFARGPQEGSNQQAQNPLLGLLTIVPIVLFLLFTFFSSSGEPVRPPCIWLLPAPCPCACLQSQSHTLSSTPDRPLLLHCHRSPAARTARLHVSPAGRLRCGCHVFQIQMEMLEGVSHRIEDWLHPAGVDAGSVWWICP